MVYGDPEGAGVRTHSLAALLPPSAFLPWIKVVTQALARIVESGEPWSKGNLRAGESFLVLLQVH
jgi:hypothetical protein